MHNEFEDADDFEDEDADEISKAVSSQADGAGLGIGSGGALGSNQAEAAGPDDGPPKRPPRFDNKCYFSIHSKQTQHGSSKPCVKWWFFCNDQQCEHYQTPRLVQSTSNKIRCRSETCKERQPSKTIPASLMKTTG